MESALYDERSGYYGAGHVRFGVRGDFTTSSGASALFGECLARWIAGRRTELQDSGDFHVVEIGPGDGRLAADILGELDVPYVCVERSPALRELQRVRLAKFADRVRWTTLEELAHAPVTGVVVANEVFDALPVHRVRAVRGAIEELFVGDGVAWLPSASEPLRRYVERYAPWALDCDQSPEIEVCLDAFALVDACAGALVRGAIVVIDYGEEASTLYGPHRPHGTVRAFRNHALVDDVLADPGHQDITASVNFSAIADRACDNGLTIEPLVVQHEFLRRNGIVERAMRLAADPDTPLAERLAAKSLLVPQGFGGAFKVLILTRR